MGYGKALVGLAGATLAVGALYHVAKKTRKKLKKSKIKFY